MNPLKNAVFKYFKFLAKIQLRKNAPDIIGITGSAGKTTTMHAVHAVLKDKYDTKASYKANSHSGIPLNILDISPKNFSLIDWIRMLLIAPIHLFTKWPKYHKYIAEMGIDSPDAPGNMQFLLSILKPRTGIFLNVRAMHSYAFDHLVPSTEKDKLSKVKKLIAREKGRLITSLPENGLAILNNDDPNVKQYAKKTNAQVLTFGQKNADVSMNDISHSMSGTSCVISYQDQSQKFSFPSMLLPVSTLYSILAACCIAIDEDYTLKEAAELVSKSFTLPPGRSSLISGKKGSLILDSSYNASADPVIDLMHMATSLKPKRLVGLLGDIRELGEVSDQEHKRVLKEVEKSVDLLVLVGPHMHKQAQELGIKNAYLAKNSLDAAKYILRSLNTGDLIVVKGSQNTIFLETAVEMLMANPKKASQVLCRQSEHWLEIKREFFKTS